MPSLRKHHRHQTRSVSPHELQLLLEKDLDALPFSLPEGSLDQFVDFILLLDKWNSVYNLTSVRDMTQMVGRHILDSLIVNPFLHGEKILDVGCGAGLPGIPLAIINPDKQFTLLDSNQKKTRFVQQAKTELQLDNVIVVNERVEEFNMPDGVNTVIARAFSSIENLISGVDHLLADDAEILAMKGTYPMAELENIPQGFKMEKIETLDVPGLDAERHLVMLSRS
ncbi:MAG: 16S rRNA (guanine(527)-N(7))-methyltransferase RsmG [Gammaproteobacteria bacterium]|nr:16S rRNA (guanine(527)-N(7))-methyltransferase RsmG [Gammaproteobacteria bacterium]